MRSDITVTIEKPVFIDPEISDQVLESVLRSIFEPGNGIPEKTVCLGKNRIENLSRVIYKLSVCMCPESPGEIPPDKLQCKFCNTKFLLTPEFKVEFNADGNKNVESIYNLYESIKIKKSDIYNILPEVSRF